MLLCNACERFRCPIAADDDLLMLLNHIYLLEPEMS